jgi:hypothetical protein
MAGGSSSTSVAGVWRRGVRGFLAEVSDAIVACFFLPDAVFAKHC